MADFPSPGLRHRESDVYQIKLGEAQDAFAGRGRLHFLNWRTFEIALPLATQSEKDAIDTLWESKLQFLEWTVDIDGTTETVRFVERPRFESVSGNRWKITARVETEPTT